MVLDRSVAHLGFTHPPDLKQGSKLSRSDDTTYLPNSIKEGAYGICEKLGRRSVTFNLTAMLFKCPVLRVHSGKTNCLYSYLALAYCLDTDFK